MSPESKPDAGVLTQHVRRQRQEKTPSERKKPWEEPGSRGAHPPMGWGILRLLLVTSAPRPSSLLSYRSSSSGVDDDDPHTLFIWPLVRSGRCSFRPTPCSTPENTDKRLTVNTLMVCFKLTLFFWTSVQDVTALSSYLSLVEKDVG